MALPDISTLTSAEMQDLIILLSTEVARREQSAITAEADLRRRAGEVNTALTQLLGPAAPTAPGTSNINAVLKYTDAQMASAAGLGLRLAFTGLKQLTEAMIVQNKILSGKFAD